MTQSWQHLGLAVIFAIYGKVLAVFAVVNFLLVTALVRDARLIARSRGSKSAIALFY